MATTFSLFPLLFALITRSSQFDENTTIWQIIGAYYFAAVVGSLVVGLLLPFARRESVAMLLGAFCIALAYGSVSYAMSEEIRWGLILVMGAFLGPILGLVVRQLTIAEIRKTTVVAHEASNDSGFGLAISFTIDEDHPLEKEIRIVNEQLVNWIHRRGPASRDIVFSVEACPALHEEILDSCKRLMEQDLHAEIALSTLACSVLLIDPKSGEVREFQANVDSVRSRAVPPPLPQPSVPSKAVPPPLPPPLGEG